MSKLGLQGHGPQIARKAGQDALLCLKSAEGNPDAGGFLSHRPEDG